MAAFITNRMILLDVAGVTKHFGPEPVLDGVSFEIRPGERIGLVGPNGAARRRCCRFWPADGARFRPRRLHPSARLAYLEQQPTLAPGRTLWDEALAALSDLLALSREAEEVAHALAATADDPAEHHRLAARYDHLQHELHHRDAYNLDHKIERVLDGLGFPRESFRQPVEPLSGGEQNRLMLAKLLLAEPNLMLLDEPSNHLDIEATEWLEEFLAESRRP